MRLVDADALIQELHNGIFSCFDCRKDYEYLGIDDYIRNQPTAYDVDKVVEQLEEEAYQHYEGSKSVDLEFAIGAIKEGMKR